ncbi:aspartate 1-decarboxylase [Flavobacteriaceae bacterium]|jgi:aspartate 1-decarboxylase|nr:aspartate 1-decarboxylase [Flavobacteriaceae bacterium]MDA9160416.1 aspartate 1-decarboxylase [Flavobacteriaceae bacterium]MDA9203923.1 aspartate 1-decarboxylase [Flavobacteriaceae bacterium]MDA9818691.1 aspartate 1-decarboxylase [Flavobacteriaceae bacterium]MDA9883185.1 aspartate 1-decarboxylase [Flavobacteriaceae bacterium]
MLIEVLKSKIHRIKVTDGNLNYIGSLTLDLDLMDKVGLIHGEKIQVLNVENGERLETYVIQGERGKGEVIVNGPATFKIKKGDLVIINSYAQVEFELAKNFQPKLLIFD